MKTASELLGVQLRLVAMYNRYRRRLHGKSPVFVLDFNSKFNVGAAFN